MHTFTCRLPTQLIQPHPALHPAPPAHPRPSALCHPPCRLPVLQLKYLSAVLSESMRLFPSVSPGTTRYTDRPYQLGPYKLPQGGCARCGKALQPAAHHHHLCQQPTTSTSAMPGAYWRSPARHEGMV